MKGFPPATIIIGIRVNGRLFLVSGIAIPNDASQVVIHGKVAFEKRHEGQYKFLFRKTAVGHPLCKIAQCLRIYLRLRQTMQCRSKQNLGLNFSFITCSSMFTLTFRYLDYS